MKSWKNTSLVLVVIIITFMVIKRHDSRVGTPSKNPGTISTSQDASNGNPSNNSSVAGGTNSGTAPNNISTNGPGSSINNSAVAPNGATAKTEPVKKENNCFKFSYQHQSKNQNRDIEEFLNDTNAFPIAAANVNQKSVCVKVNDKPVSFKFVKKAGKAEVVVGSVVGPESTIQVSYCVGSVPCKESCAVKTKNKVDELLSDSEMGGIENAELETQVKELRNVASVHEDLMDSTIIRDWNQLQSKEWVCEK